MHSQAIHFLNQEEQEEAAEFLSLTTSFVIPNGIDVSSYRDLPSKKELTNHYPETLGKTVVLYLGRIHEKKGLDILIPALRQAEDVGVPLHLMIAGPDEGHYRSKIEKLIVQHRVGHATTFVGEVIGRKKELLLGGADVFSLPSFQEGDSVAVKEALASGLPVIITKACHLSDVETYSAGIICDTDVEQISRALIRLGSDARLRKTMSKNARKLILEKYQNEMIIKDLETIYLDVLNHTNISSKWSQRRV